MASRLLLLLCFYGFCGFWFLRPLGLFWLFTLSLYACVCERNLHSFSARVLTCPFESSENRISGHLLKLFSNCIYILYLSCVSQRLHGCHDSVSTCVPYCSTRCILCSISIHPECHIQHCMGEQVEFFCFGGRHMYIYICMYIYVCAIYLLYAYMLYICYITYIYNVHTYIHLYICIFIVSFIHIVYP